MGSWLVLFAAIFCILMKACAIDHISNIRVDCYTQTLVKTKTKEKKKIQGKPFLNQWAIYSSKIRKFILPSIFYSTKVPQVIVICLGVNEY